jgi:hypothetical protein
MAEKPLIEAEVTFLPLAEGGRARPPDMLSGRYMLYPDAKVIQEDYLGVAFVTGPSEYVAGSPGKFTLELMYYPRVEYDALRKGATFTVREGGKVVGFGRVIGGVPQDIA